MSIKRIITGKIFITDFLVAKEVVKAHPSVEIQGCHFVINPVDFYAQSDENELRVAESAYRSLLEEKHRKLEEERIRLEEERKRLEEEKRIVSNQQDILRQLLELEKKQENNKKEISLQQEEARKIQPQIQKYCQERLERITANASKKGYVVKKKIVENDKIKLILQRKEF